MIKFFSLSIQLDTEFQLFTMLYIQSGAIGEASQKKTRVNFIFQKYRRDNRCLVTGVCYKSLHIFNIFFTESGSSIEEKFVIYQ